MKPFERILVPTDFSPHSVRAVEVAADLAKTYGASLTLIHVYEPLVYTHPDGHPFLIGPQLDRLLAELERLLADAKRAAEAAGAPHVTTRLLQGFASGEIRDCAAAGRHDLVVMGTHGRKGVSHIVLGSVAERVIRLAPCPVLTVHVHDKPKEGVPAELEATTRV